MGVSRAAAAAVAVAIVALVGCSSDSNITDDRRDTPQDSPTAPQRPASTGVPDESTTSSTEPGDGSLEGGEGSSTTVQGAQPGRPQLDGEPTQEPSG